MDDKLIKMLNDLQYTSQLKTSICIQLADYAAQMMGYRSTRQINSNDEDKVEELYTELLNKLLSISDECRSLIERNQLVYRKEILLLNDDDLINKLEDTLFNAVIFNDSKIFVENFIED